MNLCIRNLLLLKLCLYLVFVSPFHFNCQYCISNLCGLTWVIKYLLKWFLSFLYLSIRIHPVHHCKLIFLKVSQKVTVYRLKVGTLYLGRSYLQHGPIIPFHPNSYYSLISSSSGKSSNYALFIFVDRMFSTLWPFLGVQSLLCICSDPARLSLWSTVMKTFLIGMPHGSTPGDPISIFVLQGAHFFFTLG